MKLRNLFFLALAAALLLAACGAPGSQAVATQPPAAATLAPVTPEPGKGALTGQVAGAGDRWPDQDVNIYAAPFMPTEGGNGYYMLEPNVHPHGALGPGGVFQINNISPGSYVLVVGPEPNGARLVVDAEGKTRIFTVKEGEVTELGKVVLAN